MNGLELQDILLTFPEGGRRRTVLDIPYLKVTSGEHIGIRGASGSGKSSLLNVVSGLVLPDRGTVRWGATVPGALSEHERDRWRGQHIGFVFQDFQLFPELEALENVLLPASFTGWRIPEALIRRGRGLLEQMHVCPTRKVRALSRGEKQRVAIARAVLLKPGIILADEPTASLDEANAGQVTLLLSGYARTLGSTLLVVSHDDAVLADMDRVLALVLALSLSLGVGVSMTERAVRQGTARAGDAFDLLVGAQGSSVQLMLGAVYLRPQSLPLVPGGAVTEILTQEGVVWAAPLAFGDRWNASPLVGTTTDMVTLGGNRTLAEGRAFAAQDEAVLGAGVPLRLGEAFSPMHGQVSASHNEHGHVRYKAVGRLPETGTPWDNAILIPIESVWAVHDALPDAGHGLPLGHLFEGKGSPLPGVSAVVVKPESIAAAYRLRAFWQTATLPDADGRPVNMQGVFTGEVLTELFATLGDMRDIMTGMAYAAQFVALCGVMLVGGMAVSMRKRMLGTLRVLGAPRAYLVLSVWCVVSVSIAVGTLAGLLFGCGLSEGAALLMFRQTGIMLSPQLTLAEGSFAAASFALGSLCALFPAYMVYRKTGAVALGDSE